MITRITRMLFLFVASCMIAGSSFAVFLPTEAATENPFPTEVKAATSAFANLSRHERRARINEAKKAIKDFKQNKKDAASSGTTTDENKLLLVILAILLPPLAVYLHEDALNTKFWISLLLTFLFWIPGVIYALIVVLGDK
jgi:uncharacterized membrane protein YqaE (UPF0057 family)